MGLVVLEGIIITVLVLTVIRRSVFAAVHPQLKVAIGAGIDMPSIGLLGQFSLHGSFTNIGIVTAVLLVFTLLLSDMVPIGAGFVTYTLIKLVRGKARQFHWMMCVVAVLFVVYFAVKPIESLLGG